MLEFFNIFWPMIFLLVVIILQCFNANRLGNQIHLSLAKVFFIKYGASSMVNRSSGLCTQANIFLTGSAQSLDVIMLLLILSYIFALSMCLYLIKSFR